MDETRREKVAANIMTTVASMLNNGSIKDPRLGFVTVTSVEVTGDLQHAKVYYTAYGSESEKTGTAAALASARGLIRSRVGKNLGTRLTPTLDFVADPVPDQAAAVESALAEARAADEALAARKGTEFAGEADPYKKPREEE
ncbi:MAG: 30S ribosome-binding factor RbfA [Mobiluncus porci]|uniref:Ribosome-binding factor A n=1 Tax=Mobiluncus porci TaxID=2652278 RepID=A0A7K0K1L1_9ACTO|nr:MULTISPECIES: 30S ribosome-binding factor RbfA [Mobiluncus]MCI6584263.1 30S ribosome-binding factor RbfA [Mobiluncus sp.]MDD7540736.1 30S ribosome-binding factor RbfA [Mobiluncus porci]MDY5748298.1 30S ribosome-binding factor RbfA [Mobiluncus porci]MST49363.1 30S ribosome-binding factor RbfA [Mobiluncus porci]